MALEKSAPADFIREIINGDIAGGANGGRVHTRFPPEPNGYLHIGHAKSICLNFGIAGDYGGKCNLRFDDTNPSKEDVEYVESIREDVRWLGFDWEDRIYYASDYFHRFYEFALELIRKDKAYVCNLSPDEIRKYRGTYSATGKFDVTAPGKNSPYRDRSVAENLELFGKMKNGGYNEGEAVLRAKIDMAHPNLNMRDPIIYRVMKVAHHRTGGKWCIYPMYDYAHCVSDALEGITHSICTLEFENHRPLYDWFLDELGIHHPRQIEFARLNLGYTVVSKRKLLTLVRDGLVSGWDDPRMPTIQGMRRRGYTPAAIRDFCATIGVAKTESRVDFALLEHCVRQDLNRVAPRRMVVLNPLRLVIENYPEDGVEELEAVNNPEDPAAGTRKVPFSRVLYVERDDFMENPPKKFFRLAPGREVRLRYAYFVTCVGVIKDAAGNVTELRCTYDPETRGGDAPDGRKVKATLHWVSARHAVDIEVRLYDRLFSKPDPDKTADGGSFIDSLNPDSLTVQKACKAEPIIGLARPEECVQFERQGYFCADRDTTPERPVFNRTVALRDSWAKIGEKGDVAGD